MWAMKIGVITLVGTLISISSAADLPVQMMPGAEVGVPSLIGELTIRTAAGRESYAFKRGESLHFELTVRNLEEHAMKLIFPDLGANVSFTLVTENVDAAIPSAGRSYMVEQLVREMEIAPRAIEKYTLTWNQKYGDARGKSLGQVKPGVYRVIAQYRGRLAKSGQCVSVMKTFRIE